MAKPSEKPQVSLRSRVIAFSRTWVRLLVLKVRVNLFRNRRASPVPSSEDKKHPTFLLSGFGEWEEKKTYSWPAELVRSSANKRWIARFPLLPAKDSRTGTLCGVTLPSARNIPICRKDRQELFQQEPAATLWGRASPGSRGGPEHTGTRRPCATRTRQPTKGTAFDQSREQAARPPGHAGQTFSRTRSTAHVQAQVAASKCLEQMHSKDMFSSHTDYWVDRQSVSLER